MIQNFAYLFFGYIGLWALPEALRVCHMRHTFQHGTSGLAEIRMDRATRKKLEKVGTAAELLDLTDEEAAFVELKLALSDELRQRRMGQGLSQVDLAHRLGSSQSRVAKMEASDASVSVDLLLRGLLATGASRADIASAIGRGGRRRVRKSPRQHKVG